MNGISSPPDVDRTERVPIAPEVRAALERFAEETCATYVRKAQDQIRRLRIDELELAAEGAVSAAWVVFYQRLGEGKIPPRLAPDELEHTFDLLLRHVLSDAARRQRAGKRDRSRTVHLSALEGAGCDAIDRKACRAEERASGEEQGDSLVDLLGGEDESLGTIAHLKMEGLKNEEIASQLGRPTWYVKRKLDQIRAILRPLYDDRGRSSRVGRVSRPVLRGG